MTMGTRKTHDFCWINVMTPGAEGARAFFGKLLGWTFGEMPGVPGGQIIQVGGRTAGALMDLALANMPPGTPPAIGVMMKVESADAAVAKIAALGGRAEAFDVLENGRMVMGTDPNGAVFGLWQPKKQTGMDVDGRAHGAPTWFETLTSDVGRAVGFYTALFGWTAEEQAMPGMTYTLFKLDGVNVAGAMRLMPQAGVGDVPPHWGTSFAVTDAAATARLAVELGGKLCMPVHHLAGVGHFALLQSPQGVAFHIIQWEG